MWFVFPQLRGLGRSPMAQRYGIENLAEARAYLGHGILGPRLYEGVEAVLSVTDKTLNEILGFPDDVKFRSSMTLFALASGHGGIFRQALDRYCDGQEDQATCKLLRAGAQGLSSSLPELRCLDNVNPSYFREGDMQKLDATEMWSALNDANKARARVYVEFFRSIERRFGRDAAIEVTREAVYNWGSTLAGGLEQHLPSDFPALCGSFAFAPDEGRMFSPDVSTCSDQALVVQFKTCPLKSGWMEAGLSDDEVALFCSMAACADYGTLEAAGFKVDIATWKPGQEGCCSLSITAP